MTEETKSEEKKDSIEEGTNLDKLLEKSTEKAVKAVSKNELIEKQNVEMKRLLRLLPFQIFLLVAHADGEIDSKEVSRFKELLNHRKNLCTNQYTLRMFHATVVNYSALTNRYYGGHIKKDFEIVEKAMNYVRMCVSERMVIKICDDLKKLAIGIAEASGGFLGVTSPISKKERAVIDKLDSIFQQTIDEADEVIEPGSMLLDF